MEPGNIKKKQTTQDAHPDYESAQSPPNTAHFFFLRTRHISVEIKLPNTMARLTRRISRYFSLSRRNSQPAPLPKISKAQISHPILSPEDSRSLFTSCHPAHAPSKSTHTISDAELRALEQEKLSRRLDAAIDDILAHYSTSTPRRAPAPPHRPAHKQSTSVSASTPQPQPNVQAREQMPTASPTPSSSSVYSSPPPTPALSAKLEVFRDTPPPAPGWDKVCFGRRTRLFGPEGDGPKFLETKCSPKCRQDLDEADLLRLSLNQPAASWFRVKIRPPVSNTLPEDAHVDAAYDLGVVHLNLAPDDPQLLQHQNRRERVRTKYAKIHTTYNIVKQKAARFGGTLFNSITATEFTRPGNLLRVIEVHHLTINPDASSQISHGLTESKIDKMISAERTNKFGPKSWLRKAVLGKAYSIKIQTLKNNYTLMARYHEIAPPDAETQAEADQRRAHEDVFRQALRQLDEQWQRTYLDHRNNAALKKAEKINTAEGEEWSRRYNHWGLTRMNPPQCQMDANTFVTHANILASIQNPLCFISGEVRSAIWIRELYSKTALTTFLWGSGNVADIQKVANSPKYTTMWRNYFGVMCDKIYRSVVVHEYSTMWATIHCESQHIRHSIASLCEPTEKSAFDGIGGRMDMLFAEFGFDDEAKWGTWKDVPILRRSLRKQKRKVQELTSSAATWETRLTGTIPGPKPKLQAVATWKSRPKAEN
ncbi:hypothetical protein C7974DRAFT_408407 [Boeremia exigua]|uniref:uncharacterized protein n=1 Tax=Boeremia exigua TaxID=749465 RepID=UPI001E8DCE9D|nr:uncharacterized protein C7974DRAFT_408407 [Boeremia exigua]KAH6644750.1 hypothetical protein C7974DRAFT_408407 [Boeremia exigua]